MNELTVQRAHLIELNKTMTDIASGAQKVPVQFNTETLKLSYSNQVQGQNNASAKESAGNRGAANQSEAAARQFIGQGTTKLSLQLWFDVTAATEPAFKVDDVRLLTAKVIYFMKPSDSSASGTGAGQLVPPGVRFQWGSFLFDGIVESIEESIELFSPIGKALRASISLTIVGQSLLLPKSAAGSSGVQPGIRELVSGQSGGSLQQLCGALGVAGAQPGKAAGGSASGAGMVGGGVSSTSSQGAGAGPRSWQQVALANGIENPRSLRPGQLIDFAARRALIVTE